MTGRSANFDERTFMSEPDVLTLHQEQDAFGRLPKERREAIARASIEAFGRNDYKGASTDDIARAAGISKGLLFFYCKSKRQLYLRTLEYLYDRVIEIVADDDFWEIDDFFELITYAAQRKMAMMRRFPWALSFCIRAFYPEHRDIKDNVSNWTWRQTDMVFKRFFANVDWGKFRDGVDARHVFDMLIWLTDGWMHQRRATHGVVDMDVLMREFLTWCDMLRAWAYKPECLGEARGGPRVATSAHGGTDGEETSS